MEQSKQLKTAYKIVERESKKSSVVAISLFGSVAIGKEHHDSDLDIEIVDDNAKSYINRVEKIDDVYVDMVILPKEFMLMRMDKYPYLNYGYVNRNILYDPKGFMKEVKKKAKQYFDKHPEIVEFWENKLNHVRQVKAKGQKPESAFKTYDEAEILFSDQHKITRNFFRES